MNTIHRPETLLATKNLVMPAHPITLTDGMMRMAPANRNGSSVPMLHQLVAEQIRATQATNEKLDQLVDVLQNRVANAMPQPAAAAPVEEQPRQKLIPRMIEITRNIAD